jgi:hypothetical protein
VIFYNKLPFYGVLYTKSIGEITQYYFLTRMLPNKNYTP